jgi:anthranilate phosphoribosyltransferase
MRPINTDELHGFQNALLELAIPFQLEGKDAIDVCGTGGDGKNSFNISTLSAFVIAGAGYKVVKHGNYGVSSFCGSSNVLESLGAKFTNDSDILNKQLENSNICFLHAPLFHPAMKAVAPIRRALGVRTFFNMLGPLVNPARPNRQLTGVFSLELARHYNAVQSKNERNYTVVHSLDGYDEVSLTSPVKYFNNLGEGTLMPEELGCDFLTPEEIHGGDTIDDSAAIFKNLLEGTATDAQTRVVASNAAMGIRCFDFDKDLDECFSEAMESIQSGRAKKSFVRMIEVA